MPGFSQTARSWNRVVDVLPAAITARAIDVPPGLDFIDTAHRLGDVGGKAVYVGYSMGGRLCLRLALDRPDFVEGLVLISATPGIADSEERAARLRSDEELALDVQRDGAEAFLERWLAQALFATLTREQAAADARIRHDAVLMHQLRALCQGAMEPLWDRLDQLTVPVALVVGELDEKYVAIAAQIHERIAQSSVHVIAGVGHAVHLEQPGAVVEALGA